MAAFKRKVTLVKPKFQFKIILTFLSIALSCMFIQMALVSGAFTSAGSTIVLDPQSFNRAVSKILWENLMVTMGLLVPFSVAVGTVVTFRIAGPVHRFEKFFRALKDGTATGPCSIRDRDEFQELCTLINEALEARKVTYANPAPSGQTVSGSTPASGTPPAKPEQGKEPQSPKEEITV